MNEMTQAKATAHTALGWRNGLGAEPWAVEVIDIS